MQISTDETNCKSFIMQLLVPEWGLIIWGILLVLALSFWVYSLSEIARSRFRQPADKLTWLLLVILVPVAGIFLYFIFGRKHRIKYN